MTTLGTKAKHQGKSVGTDANAAAARQQKQESILNAPK
jgi:hypothetical protein